MAEGGKVRLANLEGYDVGHGKRVLPPIVKGGKPEESEAGIISVPEADEEAGHPEMISVPGEEMAQRPHLSVSSQRSGLKPLEVIVYFTDKTGVSVVVEDGQHLTAGELFEYVMEDMKLVPEAREVFSLWLVSDLLELQLKPNHVPFMLVCYWDELLEKYTTASEDDIERDEPVVVFQRNVFYPRTKEMQLNNLDILRLLFFEAKENIIDGRYPLSQADCDYLAGIQALIRYKTVTPSVDELKTNIQDYYPEIYTKKKWSLLKQTTNLPENRVHDSYGQALRTVGKMVDKNDLRKAYRAYLKFCWALPYYGGAFFRGQIEHPGTSKFHFRSQQDDPVYVAVNLDGVFVIDMDDCEFVLGLLYKNLKWNYAEPSDKQNANCLPCIFLQFPYEENGNKVSKMVQVFSKEALLIDTLIDACVKLKHRKQKEAKDEDSVDGPAFLDDADGVLEGSEEVWRKLDRLCLATFDHKGNCLDNQAKKPKS